MYNINVINALTGKTYVDVPLQRAAVRCKAAWKNIIIPLEQTAESFCN